MDSVFRTAREKLEKEHRESKESGKLKLEREKKDKDAAEGQRRAVESSQRARRLEAIETLIEAQRKKVEEEEEHRKECYNNIRAKTTNMPLQRRAEVFISDDEEEGSDLEDGLLGMSEQEKEKIMKRRMRRRLFRRRRNRRLLSLTINHIE